MGETKEMFTASAQDTWAPVLTFCSRPSFFLSLFSWPKQVTQQKPPYHLHFSFCCFTQAVWQRVNKKQKTWRWSKYGEACEDQLSMAGPEPEGTLLAPWAGTNSPKHWGTLKWKGLIVSSVPLNNKVSTSRTLLWVYFGDSWCRLGKPVT